MSRGADTPGARGFKTPPGIIAAGSRRRGSPIASTIASTTQNERRTANPTRTPRAALVHGVGERRRRGEGDAERAACGHGEGAPLSALDDTAKSPRSRMDTGRTASGTFASGVEFCDGV